jgi:hypothetical protein
MNGSSVASGVTAASRRLFGVIVQRHGPAIGLAADIAYTVRVDMPLGAVTVGPVQPNHRRPSSTLEIEAAEVGDICDVYYNGGRMYFQISEGLAAGEECV